jgi:hypothetical protein
MSGKRRERMTVQYGMYVKRGWRTSVSAGGTSQ